MIVADVTFYPIGKGTSASAAVLAALEAMKDDRVQLYPNSMATVIQAGSLDEIFACVKRGEDTLLKMGFKRIETILRIDHRIDVENSVERKLRSIGFSND
ncbi:MAG TPA: MTH1187 family thiamine-binding protein [Thermoplasmataceae archaeon]|nr:MTH1187 family thiamine-binding protein [Thermoplasmataceae archaeon]